MTAFSATPKQLVVLAGGMGTRLAAVTGGLPKALVPVGGRPVVERQVELAVRYGIERVLLLLGHGAERVAAWTKTWAGQPVDFSWLIEQQPRGTGGALLDALPLLDERFLLFFADQLLDFDVERLAEHHVAAANEVTVVVHPNDHPHDSDLLAVDAAGRVTALHRPPHGAKLIRNTVNAATYIVDRRCLKSLTVAEGSRVDLARDLLPKMIAIGTRVGAYRSREYLKDMGTPERLAKVETDLASGVVAGRRADRPMAAILLDRDGTINVERGRISRPEQLELIPGVAGAIKKAHAAGYLVAVVTNQPVVARGDCTFEELEAIHARLEMLLAESRAYVDAIFVCPHHPDRGFEGEVPDLKGPCRCRKPATGLVDDAVSALHIDTSATWLIGDSSTDVACALEAGLIPALVATGHAGMDGHYPTDYALRFSDSKEAIDFAVDVFPSLWRRCLTIVDDRPDQSPVRVAGCSRDTAENAAKLIALAARRRGRATSITSAGGIIRLAPHGVTSDAEAIAITADVVMQHPSELVIDIAS